jgi:hypothetical protein
MDDPGLDKAIAENADNIGESFEGQKRTAIEEDYLAPKYRPVAWRQSSSYVTFGKDVPKLTTCGLQSMVGCLNGIASGGGYVWAYGQCV